MGLELFDLTVSLGRTDEAHGLHHSPLNKAGKCGSRSLFRFFFGFLNSMQGTALM